MTKKLVYKLTDVTDKTSTYFDCAWEMGRAANRLYHKLRHTVTVEYWHEGRYYSVPWAKGNGNGDKH